MDEHATRLADAIDAALPGWVERAVRSRLASGDAAVPEDAVAAARAAGRRARDELSPHVRRLLAADVDEQDTTPLSILRTAVRYPTSVLADAGAAPVERDPFRAERFPDDPYDLTPASWADIDESLVEPGIAWGAAKAFHHRRRHRGSEA